MDHNKASMLDALATVYEFAFADAIVGIIFQKMSRIDLILQTTILNHF